MEHRVNGAVSTAELERRGKQVRCAMERAGVDVLLAHSTSQEVGGYFRYLTDVPAGGYGATVILPRDADMTVVSHGELDGDIALSREGDGLWRGVGRILTAPGFPSVVQTREYGADLALRALAPYQGAVIGLAGTAQMPLAFGERVKAGLPQARFVEASDLVDQVKAIKSEEEQALVRQAAKLQDAVMSAICETIEPGLRESEVAAAGRHVSWDLGSEAGVVLIGSGPPGGRWTLQDRHTQNRALRQGDAVIVLVEVNGPGGMYAELGRTFSIGPVSPQLEEELEIIREAQRFTLGLLRPGAACADIWEAYNAFLRERGRPEERRVHCHGQGTDLVERPLVRFDETMTIQEGMNITCHPTYIHEGTWSWLCDNYLIGPDGPGECLHAFPQRIFEV